MPTTDISLNVAIHIGGQTASFDAHMTLPDQEPFRFWIQDTGNARQARTDDGQGTDYFRDVGPARESFEIAMDDALAALKKTRSEALEYFTD